MGLFAFITGFAVVLARFVRDGTGGVQ